VALEARGVASPCLELGTSLVADTLAENLRYHQPADDDELSSRSC